MHVYIQAFRNTPPMIQLLFFYFGLGAFTPRSTWGILPADRLGVRMGRRLARDIRRGVQRRNLSRGAGGRAERDQGGGGKPLLLGMADLCLRYTASGVPDHPAALANNPSGSRRRRHSPTSSLSGNDLYPEPGLVGQHQRPGDDARPLPFLRSWCPCSPGFSRAGAASCAAGVRTMTARAFRIPDGSFRKHRSPLDASVATGPYIWRLLRPGDVRRGAGHGIAWRSPAAFGTLLVWMPFILRGFLSIWHQLSHGVATILGVGLGMLQLGDVRFLRSGALLVTHVFRNSPWLVILFVFMLLVPFQISSGTAGCDDFRLAEGDLAFSLPVMANLSEIIRGAIVSIRSASGNRRRASRSPGGRPCAGSSCRNASSGRSRPG